MALRTFSWVVAARTARLSEAEAVRPSGPPVPRYLGDPLAPSAVIDCRRHPAVGMPVLEQLLNMHVEELLKRLSGLRKYSQDLSGL
jgi:hypothetical protein